MSPTLPTVGKAFWQVSTIWSSKFYSAVAVPEWAGIVPTNFKLYIPAFVASTVCTLILPPKSPFVNVIKLPSVSLLVSVSIIS